MRTLLAAGLALPWAVWALARVTGVELPYPFVAALAFTPYAAVTSPLPVVVALVLRRWAVAGVAAVVVLAFALAVLPRAAAGQDAEPGGPRLVVMTSNLWVGRADARAALRVARRYDVDVWSLQELRPELMDALTRAGARETFPSAAVDPREGASGTGILSRLPLELLDDRPDETGNARPEVRLRPAGALPVRLKAVHPSPPVNRAAAPRWRRALRAIPGSDGRGDVRILAGDFNATLDHPELRGVLDRGYVDAADAVGKGLVWTWPARGARALPLTIDHVLVDRRVRVERVTVVRLPNTDHRAVIAVLRLPRG
jgi:endonuclease/exonuclease/phosphatase (EEP) superfamily protein YafD